jgi:thioesterase domain-containing protein
MTVLRSDLRESTLCDPRRVWESLSPSMTLIDVPGNHMTMIRLPFLATLAERLSACVDAARANGVGRPLSRQGRPSGPASTARDEGWRP